MYYHSLLHLHFALCICVWVYVCFVCIYVCIPWVAGIHRGNQILWDWIYSQLWATMWMLGIESGASERVLFSQHSQPHPNLDKAMTLEWVKPVVLPWEENINFADQFFSSIKMVCKSFLSCVCEYFACVYLCAHVCLMPMEFGIGCWVWVIDRGGLLYGSQIFSSQQGLLTVEPSL